LVDGLAGQAGHRLELVRGEGAARERSELGSHAGESLAQGGSRPRDGGHRVVQLVGQTGGHRAQGHQPLVALDRVAGVHARRGEPLQEVDRHREPLPHRLSELGGGQLEEAAVGHRSGGGRIDPRNALIGPVEVEGSGVGAAVVGANELDLAPLHPTRHRHHPGQQHEEARRGRTFAGDDRARRVLDDPTEPGDPRELIGLQGLEEEQRPKLVRRQPLRLTLCWFGSLAHGLAHWCSRNPWTSWIAIAPSPTADATRFTELARTSPAANTPGELASR
jgi:hypothetical protein